MKSPLVVALLLLAGVAASAQEVPPALFAEVDGQSRPLEIASVSTEARIHGPLAETATTIVFHNPNERDLEGELYFPLPDGATVSGYALDVRGTMVDGVAVTREKARRTFEKEVRKGIDPGIVEWTRGNVFRTRIFPLPAGGTRTVTVRYVSELDRTADGDRYVLPLAYGKKIGEFSLRVVVAGVTETPTIADGGIPDYAFAEQGGHYVAEATRTDFLADDDLVVLLPPAAIRPVLVEKDERGVVRFLVATDVAVPETEPRPAPGRIAVLWDASGSRAGGNHEKELAFLRAALESALVDHPMVGVGLTVFRDRAEPAREMSIDRTTIDELISTIEALPYDGGTGTADLVAAAAARPADLVLLFSDGIETFGETVESAFPAPLYAIHASPLADAPRLQALARASGGRAIDLDRVPLADAVAALRRPVYRFLGATANGSAVGDICPGRPVPAGGRFLLAGVLRSENAELTLRFGYEGPTETKTIRVSAADAVPGDLVRTWWAQARLRDLLSEGDRNEREITDLGRRHGLVTPFTSLIVLESLDQYLEHRILPPASLPELRAEYVDIVENERRETEELERSKLERIVELWRARVAWWETEFEYPEDFRYEAENEAKAEAEADGMETPDESAAPPPGASGDDASGGGGFGFEFGEDGDDGEDSYSAPAIALKEWDPDTPYVKALKAADPADRYAVYLSWRGKLAGSPAFFLDCADLFFREGEEALGVRVLSNLAEMELEDAALLRVLAHRLEQAGKLDLAIRVFEQVRRLRPEEPQSFRDLGLAYAKRGSREDLKRAIDLLYHVVLGRWERFEEIELLTLMELNRILPRAREAGVADIPVDPRLVKPLPLDVRIVMTWDADLTDMDLHVVEPSGEEAFYGHNRTTIGGLVSRDFTEGYGPEEYILRRAMPGRYVIKANYYGSSAARLIGPVTLHVDVYTNYGRPNERVRSMTLRLKEAKESFVVGEIEF